MKIALYAALMVAVCLMVSVEAQGGGRQRGRGRGPPGGGRGRERGGPRRGSSSEEDGGRSGERRGPRGPFGLCGICQVQDGAGVVLHDKVRACVAPDTCFTDAPKAVLADAAGVAFRQLFVCASQKDMTLDEIAAACGPPMPTPPPTDGPALP